MMEREDLNWKGAVIAQKAIRTMYLLCSYARVRVFEQPHQPSSVWEPIYTAQPEKIYVNEPPAPDPQTGNFMQL